MTGYELHFIDENNDDIDVEGPFFDTKEDIEGLKAEALSWLNLNICHKVKVCTNEYLPDGEEGYSFNDCYREGTYTKEMFINSFIE